MKKLSLFAALSMLGLAAPAFAQMGPGGPEMMGGGEHQRMFMYLKAAKPTEEQKAQIKQIMKATHEQVRPLEHQIRGLHEQLGDKLASTGSLQLSDLASVRQQIRDLQVKIDDLRLGAVVQVHAILKPDQLQRVADLHAKMKNIHQQMEELQGPPEEGEMPGHEAGY